MTGDDPLDMLAREGVVIADGWTSHATVDAVSLRPTRVPDWLAAALVSRSTASSSPAA